MKIEQQKRHRSAFQQPVDEYDLRMQLSRELSGESIVEVAELSTGLFNNTYRVNTLNKSYILKIAPHQDAEVLFNEQNLMQRERTIARQLQSQSRLIPEYLSFFAIDGRDASLQSFVDGQLWHDVMAELTEAENAQLWQQLGAFAKRMHSCRGNQFGYPICSRMFNRWSEFLDYNVTGLVEDCRRFGVLCDEVETYSRYLPRFSKLLDEVKEPKLLHGDLWPRNVLFGGSGADIHVKAVFDGERAFWGDPLSDWVLILYGVPDAFWVGYGENLLETGNPARITIYKGMYFIVNILECIRFQESDEAFREQLSGINEELEKILCE
jgi:fructosamine-3-kinase